MIATSPDAFRTHESAAEAWEELLDGLFADVFRPAPRLSVSEWAERNRVLSKETSAEPGPWRNDRTPYLVEIMDALSDPDVTEIVVMKSARIGYTEGVIGNGIGYFVEHDPSPILVIQPTEGDAEDWSKKQLSPMLRDCPSLARLIPQARSRDSSNTILDKVCPGGSITIRGAHSPRGLRRMTARVVFFDEVSAFERSAGAEGDPVKLGETRADTFANRKVVKGSTPTVKGHCRITQDFERTDKRRWFVRCPHCEAEQVLRWGGPDTPYGIKWEREVSCARCTTRLEEDGPCPGCGHTERRVEHRPETAYYLCEACASPIEERHKPAMVRAGRWVATNPGAKVRGYHINALVSLISDKARWSNLVQEWLDAQQDAELLQVFVNTVLAEAWESAVAELKLDEERAERYLAPDGSRVEVPMGVGVLTAFVDVQHDRLELLIRGWGAKEESWMIAHHRLYGDPALPQVWQQLEALRTRGYRHEGGATLRISAMGVDSGDGNRKNDVYDYVRPRQGQGVYATKGEGSRQREPIRIPAHANPKSGIRLVNIGTHPMKATLFSRLALRPKDGQPLPPGYLHFRARDPDWMNGADAEYFAQFGREIPQRKKQKDGRWAIEYVATGANEAIDLEVGCLAMLHVLGPAVRSSLAQRVEDVREAGEAIRRGQAVARPTSRRGRVRSQGIR